MVSACVEILVHMDVMMVLSALVRDMAEVELELGEPGTGLSGAQLAPGSPYMHGALVSSVVGIGQQRVGGCGGWGLLSDPVTVGSQGLQGQVG